MDIIRKSCLETKEIDLNKHTVTVMVSAETIDRDKEIIQLNAWKNRLGIYKQHPIILANHESWDIRNQIGKALEIYVIDGIGLFARMEYFVGVKNDLADWAWYLVTKGMGAWSVGFMAHATADGDGAPVRRVFTDVELYEISQVLVPSLREAIQRDRSLEQNKEMMAIAKSVYKSGRVISTANLEKLKTARNALTGAIEAVDELINIAEPQEENQDDDKSLTFPEQIKKGLNTAPIGADNRINELLALKRSLEKEE